MYRVTLGLELLNVFINDWDNKKIKIAYITLYDKIKLGGAVNTDEYETNTVITG